ncbi:MAG TPA: hypothetical protein VHO23_02920 [Candidatus Paceibacterota bacterium]|nr:hypothetical protein [Candidatus Paceibacterota bacterium]
MVLEKRISALTLAAAVLLILFAGIAAGLGLSVATFVLTGKTPDQHAASALGITVMKPRIPAGCAPKSDYSCRIA